MEEISQILNDRLTEKRLVIAERFRFYSCVQAPNESISQFIARLKKESRYCDFNDKLGEMLRDRLVCSLKDIRTQAEQIALGEEVNAKDIAELSRARHNTSEVHSVKPHHQTKIQTKNRPVKQKPNFAVKEKCKHCGKKNHVSDQCKFKSPM